MILEDFSVCLSHSTVPGKLCFLKALCAQPSSCPGSCTGFPAKCCSLLAWSRRAALQKGTYRPQKLTHTAIPAHFVLLYISTWPPSLSHSCCHMQSFHSLYYSLNPAEIEACSMKIYLAHNCILGKKHTKKGNKPAVGVSQSITMAIEPQS